MSRVLVLATTTGYQIRSFGEAAERLGVRLTIASDRCDRLEDPWWDQAIPVRFHDIGYSVAVVAGACAGDPPSGVIAVGDRPVELAAHLCRAFGLPGHPPVAAAISRNKLQVREALRASGLPVPAFFTCLSIDETIGAAARAVPYPAVIKPLALSGSRGVMWVNSPAELTAAFHRLRRLLLSPDVRIERDEAHDRLLVESFIPGMEYAVEGLLDRGRLTDLAVFDKPDPLDGPFFEETIYVTPSAVSRDTAERIRSAVAAAARAMGLHHGPVHAECRINDGVVYVLEVAARPIGGLCSRALRFAAVDDGDTPGSAAFISLEELLLRHALGQDVRAYARETAASGVMMIPIPGRGIYRGVSGVEEARRVEGIEDVVITSSRDVLLTPLPEGRSYLGFIFARARTPADVVRALRSAHGCLRFAIERAVPIAGRS